MTKPKQPTVVVFMVAYNQDKYIGEAIESVLEQSTDFNVKLIIGEDCSTDRTRNICEKYAHLNSERITLLHSAKNLGIQQNCIRTLKACLDSDYIAFCEGDDKWCDNNKLSYQTNFLEQNQDLSAHAHNVTQISSNNKTDHLFGSETNKVFTNHDFLSDWPFHTVSLMVRTPVLKKIPLEHLPYFISFDKFMNLWIGAHGSIFYEGVKKMAIYNCHEFGASRNSNYYEIRRQDIDMVTFMKPYIKKETYISFKTSAIERLAYLNAQSNGDIRTSLPFVIEYIRLHFTVSKKVIFNLLLLIFGKTFLKSYEKCKLFLTKRKAQQNRKMKNNKYYFVPISIFIIALLAYILK